MRDRNQKPATPETTSLINCQLIPRASSHVSSTVTIWPSYEQKRNELYGGRFDELNIYGLTSYVKQDCELIWQLVSTVFPQIDAFGEKDKNSLLSNFVPKWWQLEPAIDLEAHQKVWKENGRSVDNAICNFYSIQSRPIARQEVLKTFGPFWDFYYHTVIRPIAKRKFDRAEYMALILLLFFDNAYTNISEQCGRQCERIRKVVLRELKSYQADKNCDEMRFPATVETLLIIEKGERKFQEEMLICEMRNVRIHDDFREMLKEQRL